MRKAKLFMIIVICIFLLMGCTKTDKQLVIDDFRSLKVGMTQKEIIEKFGEPDGTGSGFYLNYYELENNTKVVLYFDGESKLTHVRYWVSEDKYTDIISNEI